MNTHGLTMHPGKYPRLSKWTSWPKTGIRKGRKAYNVNKMLRHRSAPQPATNATARGGKIKAT